MALASLRERLVAMYETGRPELLDVIVGEGDLEDVEAQAEYLDAIHSADEAAAGRVRQLRDGVAHDGRAAGRGERRNRTRPQRDRRRSRRTGRDRGARCRGARPSWSSARGDREAALGQVREHETELDGDVEAIQGKIAEELAATGSMPLPLGAIKPGSGVDDLAGRRADRLAASGRARSKGPTSTTRGSTSRCRKARRSAPPSAGTVAFTEPEASSGGYGNYTCIDHGGGLSTCYAHQSAFAVEAGDPVQQGEVIGYSGCTGYCLGPHVHFEVRINGEVVDPLGYL